MRVGSDARGGCRKKGSSGCTRREGMDVVGNTLVDVYSSVYGRRRPSCNSKRVVTIDVYSKDTGALP